MKWLFAVLTILREWIAIRTARKVRRAMSAEAELQQERQRWQETVKLEEKRVTEYGKLAVEHSTAAATAKLKVKEIEGRMGLWDDSPK